MYKHRQRECDWQVKRSWKSHHFSHHLQKLFIIFKLPFMGAVLQVAQNSSARF